MLKNSTEIPFGTFGKKINLFKNFFTTFLFIVIFFTGVFVVKDYGVSSDEYQHRLHGFINLNYVGKNLHLILQKNLEKIKITLNLMNMAIIIMVDLCIMLQLVF